MTQEDKELLIKDICARLPYEVKINNEIQGNFVIYGICENYVFVRTTNAYADFPIEKIKPYLFPLSSMTKKQEKEWLYTLSSDYHITYDTVDWCNKNHFDYRGLIEKELAIDATGLNIY